MQIDSFLEKFMEGNYFIIFLVLIFTILIVLVLALIKTRTQYLEMLRREEILKKKLSEKNELKQENVNVSEVKSIEIANVKEEASREENDILSDIENLKATNEEDTIDENKPLIKQIDTNNIKTYNNIIEEYETADEEQAVISTKELEQKAKERMDNLGTTDNQEVIKKYEEEQEKKAIISYEQLLKNASNISLTYKEEKKDKRHFDSEAPKINKVEIKQKEVTQVENYIKEDEFLSILKEFRLTLE